MADVVLATADRPCTTAIAVMDGKRTAHEAGLGPGNDRPAKSFRIEDFLESMDPSVRIKLRSMFDDGMLQAEDLDERNVAELRKFDAAVALEILEHYSQADFSTVRNRRAYLAGALKRKAHLANKQQLQPEVQAKLNQLMTAGSIRGGDLDKGCMDTLANLPPATAIAVLERYGGHDFSEVRNPSALFISTVKSVAGPEATAAARGYGPPPGSHSRSSGGPYGAPSGSYSSGSAAASAGGPTPRSYPGYPSLGGADHPGSRRSGGYDGGYDRYEDDHQPPPPPRQQQQTLHTRPGQQGSNCSNGASVLSLLDSGSVGLRGGTGSSRQQQRHVHKVTASILASHDTAGDAEPVRKRLQQDHHILVLGALGGRLDHTLANLNTLYCYPHLNITLWGEGNLVRLLRAGKSEIKPSRLEGPTCGLVPLARPATASSKGLKWDLDNTHMCFRGLLSTSNIISSDSIEVSTDEDLLWITAVGDTILPSSA